MSQAQIVHSGGGDPIFPEMQDSARRCVPFVGFTAKHLACRLPPYLDLDDLLQLGLLGLFQATERFDGSKSGFELFARARIRGAMLDGLRAMDSAPRSLRRRIRHIRGVTFKLEQTLGRAPSAREIAAAGAMTLSAYQRTIHTHYLHQPVYVDDAKSANHGDASTDIAADPLHDALEKCEQTCLQAALKTLSNRECRMMKLHFEDGVKLRVIGSIYSVSESRVSQILRKAAVKLRTRLL